MGYILACHNRTNPHTDLTVLPLVRVPCVLQRIVDPPACAKATVKDFMLPRSSKRQVWKEQRDYLTGVQQPVVLVEATVFLLQIVR